MPTSDPDSPLRARWQATARLVASARDVLDARPGEEGEAPPALVLRGWAGFLLALDDAQLEALELGGHEATWPAGTPASLSELAAQAKAAARIAPFATAPGRPRPARRLETPRKSAQIEAFAALVLPLARRAARVVDVGSGHGHLTREIAEHIALPVIGLERDRALAGRARGLSSAASLTFAVTDVHRDGLTLEEGDCVLGLHACGDLGDAMVESVARGGRSMVLVGCCLQKRRALSRRPLCESGELAVGLDLPRQLLGLSNLTARDDGVEATRAENLAGRERRLALHRLLSEGGRVLRLGAEIEGLNRRAAQSDLASLTARAFALRGRPPPAASAVEAAAVWARAQHARVRRLSLPRAMLARALEVLVLLDRAVYLQERGFAVEVGALFPATASARNLALFAERGGSSGSPPAGQRIGAAG